jgi:hypothetical protein
MFFEGCRMKNNEIAPLNTVFTPAQVAKGQEMAAEYQSPTLADLWGKADALRVEGPFLALRISTKEPPMRLTEGSGWMAWVKKLDGVNWEVGVWHAQLLNPHLFDNPRDKAAIDDISRRLDSLKAAEWQQINRPGPSRPAPFAGGPR